MFYSVFLSSQYFETDDPEFYKSKVCFILNNDMSEMELVFAEEKYNKSGQLDKVRTRTRACGSPDSHPLSEQCSLLELPAKWACSLSVLSAEYPQCGHCDQTTELLILFYFHELKYK